MKQSITADTIKSAARNLFAHNGFDATTVRDITGSAKANIGAVTYHFGSKQALYFAILDEVFDDLASRVELTAGTNGTPAERLRAIVTSFFWFFRGSPDAPLLVIRELARGTPPPAPVIPRVRRVLAAITGVVRDGQAAGAFRQVEPFLAAFTLVSQCVWFAVAGPHMPGMLGLPMPPGELRTRMESHIADVVIRSVVL
ncbi:MAG: TetR/AcrR family transcriptional regulator [Gemmatimonadales bacterium]